MLEWLNIAWSSESRKKPWGRKWLYKHKNGETQEMLLVLAVQRNGSRNEVRCRKKRLNAVHQVLNKRHDDEASAGRWEMCIFSLWIYLCGYWSSLKICLHKGKLFHFLHDRNHEKLSPLLNALWIWIPVIGENLNSNIFWCIKGCFGWAAAFKCFWPYWD